MRATIHQGAAPFDNPSGPSAAVRTRSAWFVLMGGCGSGDHRLCVMPVRFLSSMRQTPNLRPAGTVSSVQARRAGHDFTGRSLSKKAPRKRCYSPMQNHALGTNNNCSIPLSKPRPRYASTQLAPAYHKASRHVARKEMAL